MVIVVVVVDVGGQEGGGCCWDNYCGGSYDGCDCLWPKKNKENLNINDFTAA